MSLKSHCVNTGIGTTTACHFGQSVEYILVIEIDSLCFAIRACHPQSGRNVVDCDHPLGSEHKSTLDRELPHRSASPNRNRVSHLNIAVLGSHITGRKDI